MELLFMLAGGLGLFLYGMNEMSRGLQQIAGARLKLILQTLTQNRFVGVLTGTVATAVLQSSSVMTVMVVSFVNANLMSLAQAISVIIGANIGTTITAQIIAFNVEEFALPIIAVGAAVALFSKRDRLKALGNTVFGFGILFYGFFLMSSAFEPFGQDPAFHDFFTRFSDQPLLGLVIGLLVTIVAQSSSLTIGITIALAHSGLITFPESLPLTIGINIGSTVTANIAAIPGSYVAKQAARAHSIIKISGAIIAFLFLAQFQDLVNILAPNASTGRLIANAHTLYNIAISVIALPLIPYIAASTKYFVFGRPEKREELAYLDETSLADPGTALDQADRALSDMHSQICGYLKKIETNFLTKQKLDPSLLFELGAQVQQYEYRITHYLQKLAEQNLTKAQSQQLARTIRILHELTRMNDYIMKMSEIANEKIREDIHFSPLDKRDLRNLFKALDPVIQKVQILIHKPDRKTAENVMTRYEEIRTLRDGIRKKIQSRFASHKTTLATMHAFIDVLNALEEIAKKSSNIAETVRSA